LGGLGLEGWRVGVRGVGLEEGEGRAWG
jgi:hypothetical protein